MFWLWVCPKKILLEKQKYFTVQLKYKIDILLMLSVMNLNHYNLEHGSLTITLIQSYFQYFTYFVHCVFYMFALNIFFHCLSLT